MAEALSGSSDDERDLYSTTNEINYCDESSPPDYDESYRRLCEHYSRGCSFISPCCGKVHPCRLCHDEQESHKIDRHSITEVVCRKCSTRQQVADCCYNCGLHFARCYFCAICNFYDDVNKGQFHCEKCGICRAGGKENFFHCDKCGFCLSLEKRENHTCRQNISKNNCPICLEDIHTARDPAHVPRCGHIIHSSCFKGLMEKGLYQCPQCQTSLVDMRQNWERLDAERESWVMPQQLREFKVKVHCRDCGQEGDTLFHVAGLKCCSCGSYNTTRCGSEELPLVPSGHRRVVDWRYRRRRGRHREDRADIEKQLQNSEQRLSDTQKQLQETQRRAEEAEQKAHLNERRARCAEEAVVLAEERARIAEEKRAEAERRLLEIENDLEELMEYKELLHRTQRFSLHSEWEQSMEDERRSHCSDQLSITTL